MKSIHVALIELHLLGLSHNDIRLPKICFYSAFQVVLINIDRCHVSEELHPKFASSTSMSSCMYTLVST